jgi:hypothetical protein
MKRVITISVSVVLLSLITSSTSLAQRMISSITVVFNTTTDDKDNDTYVQCQLLSADNHWLGSRDGQFGRFPNNSTYTLPLTLGEPNYSEELLHGGRLMVLIIPNGHDTWVFTWQVIVSYNDGSQSIANGTGALDQNNNAFNLQVF